MSKLSSLYTSIAENELNENEIRKTQSLEHFREWIAKHPFIKAKEFDDICLLNFLRSKKYVMDKVFLSFEEVVLKIKNRPDLFHLPENEMENFFRQCKTSIYVLNNRALNGARIVVMNFKKFEEMKLNTNEIIKTISFNNLSLGYEEETQIAGVIIVVDCTGVGMDFIIRISANDLVYFSKLLKHLPLRMKKIIIVGLPTFARNLFNLFYKMLNQKLKSRIELIDDVKDLQKFFDTSELLDENGKYKNENFFDNKKNIKKLISSEQNYNIEWDNVKDFENIGSFRQLNID